MKRDENKTVGEIKAKTVIIRKALIDARGPGEPDISTECTALTRALALHILENAGMPEGYIDEPLLTAMTMAIALSAAKTLSGNGGFAGNATPLNN